MAKTRRLKPYQIEVERGKLHSCSRADWLALVAQRFAVPVLNGAGVPSHRVARLQLPRGWAAFTVRGRLEIVNVADRTHWPTHAAMLDRQWVFSGNGALPLPEALVRRVRESYGPERWMEAEAALREMARSGRQLLIREQFNF